MFSSPCFYCEVSCPAYDNTDVVTIAGCTNACVVLTESITVVNNVAMPKEPVSLIENECKQLKLNAGSRRANIILIREVAWEGTGELRLPLSTSLKSGGFSRMFSIS